MSIWGKLAGATAGLVLGGPLGAVLGGVAGHVADRMIDPQSEEAKEAKRQLTFTVGVIALSAKMAKADGVVTNDEIKAFREIVDVPGDEVENVRRVFRLAMQDVAGYEAYARQIANLFKDSPAVLEDLLDGLFHIALADGVVHPNELTYLERVADVFGFTELEFGRIKSRNLGPDDSDPYLILGVDPEISDEDLKSVYRRLVRDNHPDALIARGVPEEFVSLANDKLAAINSAYDRIAAERGLS